MSPNFYHTEKELRKLGVKCGKGCRVHTTVIITHPKNLKLGNNVKIDAFTTIISVKKITLQNYIHVGSYVILHSGGGTIKLDKFSGISAGVKIFTHSDDYTGKTFYSPFNANSKNDGKKSSIHLKKYVILGTNSLVLPGAKFGEGTVIGAQSVVFKKTDPWTTYFGLPLKKISKRQKKFKKNIRLKNIK
jgi:acetyltransferase-like isoleucine patch superfamily enzyme